MKKTFIVSLLSSTLLLSGCTGLLFGGAVVGGAAVASTLHDRRTPGTVIDDRNLQLSIARKIKKNDYLDDYSHVNVTVFNGVVLLTGEAGTQKIITDIVQLARTTANVKRVENALKVMPISSLLSRSNDAAITAKVKTALVSLKLPKFDPSLVKISTERGNVYLMGLLTQTEAAAIVDKARRVSGVKSVVQIFEYVQPSN